MATVQTAIINRALRLNGDLASGASPTTSETADALIAVNAILDGWRNEKLMAWAMQEESMTLTSGASSKTIGPTGDLVSTRPVAIEAAWILESTISYPVRIITDDEYANILNRTAAGDWPTHLNYKPTMSNGVVYVWPVPNATRTLKLLTRVPLTAFATAGDTVTLPPGWEEALAANLAVRIAAEYEHPASPDVVQMARMSKGSIKRANMVPLRMYSELADLVGQRRTGNILTDQ